MGILKLAGDDGIAPPLKGSEPSVPLLYESPIEMAAISDSHGTCDHQCRCARMTTLSRVRWSSPKFRSKVNSLPLAPCGFTLYCLNWWTGGVTLPDSFVANEKCCFYHYRPINWWSIWELNPCHLNAIEKFYRCH